MKDLTSEEFIRKGKSMLETAGISESEFLYQGNVVDAGVPGLGGVGNKVTFNRNREALSRYCIKTRILGDHFTPDTKIKLFGKDLSLPVMSASMSGIKSNLKDVISEKDFISSIFEGCREFGTIGLGGDSFDTTGDYVVPGVITDVGGIGVCKPRNFDILKERITQLKEAGSPAVGIDLDGLAGMLLTSSQVSRKNVEELKKIRELFKGPMFLKGILSVEDAMIAYETGYDGIVVSNHGGRSIDYSLGTADALPMIAKKLKGKIKILVDGGVKNGYDVFIYLALGADAVLIGRTLLYSVIGGGSDGVRVTLSKISSELKRAMLYTDSKNINDIDSKVIGRYDRLINQEN